MFKKKEDKIILENSDKIYDFLNNPNDYKDIILLLTDPNKSEGLDLSIDENITEDERKVCENYKKFIEDFLERKEILLKEIERKFEEDKKVQKSKIAKLSLSEYLLEQGLDKEIVIVDGLNEVGTELRRIENNINQLIYLANSGKIYTVDFSGVKKELEKIWNVINELQNKW